nr:hypothetical protein [Tanacetum cinerariifolium]
DVGISSGIDPRVPMCYKPPFKRQNTGGQNVARAYTAGNNDQRGYEGTFPYCIRSFIDVTTQGTPGLNQKVVTCFECEAQGNYRKNYPKVKNQNRENKSRVPDARGKAYVLGGGDANPGSNIVTGDKSDEKKSMLSIISCVKAHKYMEKGCQLFMAQVMVKENKDKSKEKRLEDEVPIGKVPVLPKQYRVSNQFRIPLVGSEEDPSSPREILQENSIRLTALLAVPTSLSFRKAPVDKVPVLRVQHQVISPLTCLRSPLY